MQRSVGMYLSLGHVIEGKGDDSDDTTKKCRNSYKKEQASNNNIYKKMYHKVHITVNFRNGFLVNFWPYGQLRVR